MEKLIFSDRETYLQQHAEEQSPEIFCIAFTSDGKIFRYSESKGRQRLFGEFRVKGNMLELSAKDENKFLPMGTLTSPDELLLDFRRGRKLVLRKLPHGTDPDTLDLSGPIKVEFEDESQL